VGIPFDFVAYLVTAANVLKKLGLNKIIHLIADTHALGTDCAKGREDVVRELALQQKR
jgi:predicted MPP superfamily phosphohydrolase